MAEWQSKHSLVLGGQAPLEDRCAAAEFRAAGLESDLRQQLQQIKELELQITALKVGREEI